MNKNIGLDISAIPFSRFSSYIAFSYLEGTRMARSGLRDGIWMRCVHGDAASEVMRFELIEHGNVVPCTIETCASTLTLRCLTGKVDICIPTEDTVRIRAQGVELRITARPFRNHGAIPEPDGNWIFNLASSFRSYRLVTLSGKLTVDAPWTVKQCEHIVAELSPPGKKDAELAIEQLTWMRQSGDHSVAFDAITAKIEKEFESFCKAYRSCTKKLKASVIKAAYLNWSSVVHPHRLIKRPAMLMSKNSMTNVWAWDHAFNAMATSLANPDLAWDQLMVMFDHQDENGQIPDYINDVKFLTVFVKPPVHGWILKRMIEFSGELPPERHAQAYEKLSKWTNWWLTFRNPDGDGLPVYWHGNDSGWDNGTVFDVPFPVKAPDLAAFLVVQMDILADFADKLGRSAEAGNWRQRADATLSALIDKLWDGSKFRCISTVTRKSSDPSDSVFGCLPVILGKRLPRDILKALAVEIKRHVTQWGPATEHPESSVYQPDGYWRGPIWAPATMILVDGLRSAGETELARDIAERFCRLCDKSGFAENFDAITGAPLRDRGYTWTSSVFLVLANRYLS